MFLSTWNNQKIYYFRKKQPYMPLLFLSYALYSKLIDWLIFKGEQFHSFAWISNSTLRNIVNSFVSADQLIFVLSLIKLCSACAKQNAAVNASDVCLLLAK